MQRLVPYIPAPGVAWVSLNQNSEIDYPESDGRPIAESDWHRDWMCRILELFRWRYRSERVYVSCNLLVYYQEGDPTKFVVPDNFVVLDCEPGRRRTFKIWEVRRVPDVVFEVTSCSTLIEDVVYKPQVYAQIGVKEFFLFDPTSEYLKEPLQGFRLGEGREYGRIEPSTDGTLLCEPLGLVLRLAGQELRMYDRQTGQPLLTAEEAGNNARRAAEFECQAAVGAAEDARRAAESTWLAAQRARQAAETARHAAEHAQLRANQAKSRAAQLELENERLRAEQRDNRGGD